MKMTARDIRGFLSGEPFVLFHRPGDELAELWLQKDNDLHADPHFEVDGFYVHPLHKDGLPVALIPRERAHIIRFPLAQWEMPEAGPLPPARGGTTAGQHQSRVQAALDAIDQGKIQKVVVAGYRDYPSSGWDAVATFMRLALTYPQSFVYLWHHPAHTQLLAASPEVLLRIDGHFGLTYSLAGTKTTQRPWTAKEQNEQKIVTDYIIRRLLSRGWTLSQDGPYDHRQGHLIHLRTDIRFILDQPGKSLTKVLRALHPTPAVVGLPKEDALQWIGEHEDFDRRYYTGFFGIKEDEQATFYVNLRSLEVNDKRIRLYAGGGIVAGSRPEDEWREVQHKTGILATHLVYGQ